MFCQILRHQDLKGAIKSMAYSDALWQEARKKCRLNNDDIKIAKELGLNPKSLIKNIPNKSEQWKAPVSVWIREIQEGRKNKSLQKQKRKAAAQNDA
jgi:hypothetical protein